MGRITNTYISAGEAPSAADLNAVYDSVAGDTVEDVNLDTEWAQRKHFDTTNSITTLETFDYDGIVDWTTTSTTFTTIENVSGTPSKVTPNYSTHGDVVVRVHASGLVGIVDLDTDDGDGSLAEINHNTYAFRLLMSLNGSGTPSTVDMANCTYSFTPKGAFTTEASGTQLKMNYVTFCFSGLYALSAGNVIDSIELQACVGLANNSIDIQHNHIQAIIVEN